MLKHRASEGPDELQRGATLIQETAGVRQSYSCLSLPRGASYQRNVKHTADLPLVFLYGWTAESTLYFAKGMNCARSIYQDPGALQLGPSHGS
jgi:hypothetical protein